MKRTEKTGVLKKQIWIMLASAIPILIMFVFFISIAISPLNKIREFDNLVNPKSYFAEESTNLYDQPNINALLKERSFKKALLELSEMDSIQLAVNMADSIVNLYIHGVLIQETTIESIKKDKLFNLLPLKQHLYLFSQPLPVNSQYATIVKEPLVVRHAPKNADEAALNAWKPDTLIQNPAFLILSVEHGLHLIFEQDKNPTSRDKWTKFSFYKRLWQQKTKKAVLNFIHFKKQEYYPTITIKIPVDDLRAIYRALPSHTFVVINI